MKTKKKKSRAQQSVSEVKQTVKGFAVIARDIISDAHAEIDEGCGSPSTKALGIYRDEHDAEYAARNAWVSRLKVVPCTITYSIPKKKRA